MNAVVEKLTPNRVKLTITVPGEAFAEKVSAAYRKLAPRISIPGFRKGKAPRKVIETYYGAGIFLDEAFSDNYAQYYQDAVKQHDLFVVDRPDIDITAIEQGADLVFTAEVYVRPDVSLPEYKGIEVMKIEYPITDEDVAHEIEHAMERVARWVDAVGAAAMGDRVTLDYVGEIDNEAFEGGSAEGMTLELGSGTFIPGFEEQLAGICIDEERDVNVAFPEDYRSEELRGKDAVFHVKTKEIKRKELPEVDDEFAKDVSQFDTLEEYRADIRKRLEEQAERRRADEQQTLIVDKIAEGAQCDMPEVMVDNEIDDYLNNFARSLAMSGLRFEQWLEYMGKTVDEIRDEQREAARKRVMQSLVVNKIKTLEDLSVTAEEMDEEIKTLAERSRGTVEEYREKLGANELESIQDMVKVRKTLKFLEDSATYTGVEERELHTHGHD